MTSARCWRSTRPSASTIPRPVTRSLGPDGRPSTARSFLPTASARSRRTSRRCILRRTTPARTTASRTTTSPRAFPKAIRDNYDGKINWNRNPSHQIWGKFSVMKADVMDLFYLPFEEAGGGKTTVSLWTVGSTWTLSPTLLLDANGGSNKMTHQSNGPDYGTNYGLDFRHSRAEQRGRHRSRLDRSRALQRHAGVRDRPRHARQQRDLDAGLAHGSQLHRVGQPDEGGRAATRSGAGSTSSG